MARRSAIRSIHCVIFAAVALTGFTAGSLPRTAVADVPRASGDPVASESLDATSSVAQDSYPAPSVRPKLVIAGLASSVAWYGLALGASLVWPDTVGANQLKVPMAGPWLALSHSGCGNVSDCSTAIVVLRAIATVVDGIGQASGLGIAAEGLFLPTRELKPKRGAWNLELTRPNGFEVHPTFDAGKNSIGFGVLGVF